MKYLKIVILSFLDSKNLIHSSIISLLNMHESLKEAYPQLFVSNGPLKVIILLILNLITYFFKYK